MEKTFIEKAKWIWQNNCPKSDEYAEFFCEVPGGKITAFICADSNYEMWVNGRLAAFGQYADYDFSLLVIIYKNGGVWRRVRIETTMIVNG